MQRTVVAITGASSGIGEAFARKLAPGHDLLLIARRKDRLQQLADQLSQTFSVQVDTLQADLTKDEDIAAVSERLTHQKHLALLVNNAGFGAKGRFWETDLAAQDDMHKLHVMATMRLSYAALRNMVPRNFGGIVNVSSVASFVRSPGTTSYSATKAWMTAFTEGLHLDLRTAKSSVIVQALCPGFTYSEFHEAMGVSRYKLAGPAFWHTAEEVVNASIDGLRKRKLIVIPGWRYQLLVGVLTRLPVRARIALEAVAGRARNEAAPIVAPQINKQLEDRTP